VHPEVGHDVVAPGVEEVRALGQRPAVGAHVRADGPDRSVLVDDEGSLGVVEGVLAAPALAGEQAALVAVEEVDPGGVAGPHDEGVVQPPVTEVVRVPAGGDRAVLGVGAVGPLVRGAVGA
jgi:hypothetical protein